jgi:polyhydroxybutyrate depolymerase
MTLMHFRINLRLALARLTVSRRSLLRVIVCAGMHLPLFAAAQSTGFSEHTILSAGAERSYLLYVPEGHDDRALPLLFSFHGSGATPQSQVDISGFDALADQHGFIAVFPAGAFTNTVTERSWNANLEEGVDDVQFVRDMIEDVAALTAVDRRRIYVSGYSGGGRISSRLACELSDVLAAAAPVAGLQYPDGCSLKRPIPILAFHALDDATNPYVLGAAARPYWRMGVETALDKWRQANGCSLANDDQALQASTTRFDWTACSQGAELQFYQHTGGGHTWPGSAQSGAIQDIDASALIHEFFSRHALGE